MTMADAPICLCDQDDPSAGTNPPGQSQISFRAGDFNSFREALLTPLLTPDGQPVEQALTAWQAGLGTDPSVADLAVMMVEWWAYLGDILTFYNERIANEDYLRTAIQTDTPGALVQLLGYRPRPAIGNAGTLAALMTPSILPGQTVSLPQGLQFQSKPGPGQAPQTYELSAKTVIGRPDVVSATTPPFLIAASGTQLLMQGKATTVAAGAVLLLDERDDTSPPSMIVLTTGPQPQTAASGVKQTAFNFSGSTPGAISAENGRLRRSTQNASLWTVNAGAISADELTVHMASLVRQINAGDWIVFAGASGANDLVKVTAVADVLGDAQPYATGGGPTGIGVAASAIPVLHTQLTLASKPVHNAALGNIPTRVSVLFGWAEIGTLADQPPGAWDGSEPLNAIAPGAFPTTGSTPALFQDSVGVGLAASVNAASASELDVDIPATTVTPLSPALEPPIRVYYNLLPVTQGKTITNEILGSGDGTIAGQSFKLQKSPVTYLMQGPAYASTIALKVNGQPWTEVASFYGQAAGAQVFVTSEDAQQNTHVSFGDGVNGSRLPSGTNNVVASYRVGAGLAAPAAGKLTTIAQSYPGLQSVVNPVAVSGGSDADPAALLKQYAPQSVLTFGRAVSIFDYQAIAAGAPGVTQASAVWNWNAGNQNGGVTVYVTGSPNVVTSVQTLLQASGDPNRPVQAVTATSIDISLTLTLVVSASADQAAIQTAVTTALCDPGVGLFAPAVSGIGQGVFNSAIEVACLAVQGVTATMGLIFAVDGIADSNTVHWPGEGAYFSIQTANFFPSFVTVAEPGNSQGGSSGN
jgi:uncharacterized phage protein gp47/JayE